MPGTNKAKNAGLAFRHGFDRGYSSKMPVAPVKASVKNVGTTLKGLAGIGATPLLAANVVRSAGTDTDFDAYVQLAQRMGWPMPSYDEKTGKDLNMPTPMQLKNARRQLTNRELLWMGLNSMQDAATKVGAGRFAPLVNSVIDANVVGIPGLHKGVTPAIEAGINKFYNPKFQEENRTGQEPGIADLFGFIAKHLTKPGELQGFMNLIGNQPLPEFMQHQNRLGPMPVRTAADLVQNAMMPIGYAVGGGGKAIGAAKEIGKKNDYGESIDLPMVLKYIGGLAENDVRDLAQKNLGGAAKAISRKTPTAVKRAIRTFGAAENSFIP
jgi:hypothetical protein